MVRDALATRNELVDAFLKVTDEESAKVVLKQEAEKLQKHWDEHIRKRLEEEQKKINADEKGLKNAVNRVKEASEKDLTGTRGQGVAQMLAPTLLETFRDWRDAAIAVEDMSPEIKNTAKRQQEQVKRLKAVMEQEKTKGRPSAGGTTDERVANLTKLLQTADFMGSGMQDRHGAWDAPLKLNDDLLARFRKTRENQ
jgi:transposase-like protein